MKQFLTCLLAMLCIMAEEPHRKLFSQAPSAELEGGNHSYQQSALMVPIYGKWDLEGNMYRAEGNHIGFIGSSYSFHVGKHLRIHPGAGILFGIEEPSGPALKLRTFWESKYVASEGSLIQGMRPSIEHHRDLFAEGHISLKIKAWQERHIEIGPTAEDIAYKEGKEKLFGGRLMIPAGKHFGFTFKTMTHNTVRVGVVWFPFHHEKKH